MECNMARKQETKQAPQAFELTATDRAAIASMGGEIFEALSMAGELNAKAARVADQMAAVIVRIGAHESWVAYCEARGAFIAAQPAELSEDTRGKRWNRVWQAMRDTATGAKFPKGGVASDNPEAVKKAAKRAEAKKAEAEDKRTPAELIAEAGAALKAGKASEAAELLALSKRKQAAIDAEAKAKAKAVTDPMLEVIRAALKRMADKGDAKALQQVQALCLKLSPAPKAEAAPM